MKKWRIGAYIGLWICVVALGLVAYYFISGTYYMALDIGHMEIWVISVTGTMAGMCAYFLGLALLDTPLKALGKKIKVFYHKVGSRVYQVR